MFYHSTPSDKYLWYLIAREIFFFSEKQADDEILSALSCGNNNKHKRTVAEE